MCVFGLLKLAPSVRQGPGLVPRIKHELAVCDSTFALAPPNLATVHERLSLMHPKSTSPASAEILGKKWSCELPKEVLFCIYR